MTGPVLPASGNARVCAAVSLGWQVAKLYHSPVHAGAAADPRRGPRLPGISGFPDATRSKWLAEQVDATVAALLPMPPGPVTDALGRVIGLLGDTGRSRDATLDAVFTLHCRLLESLTVADFRLGKAYGLGRSLAETTLVPAAAAADDLAGAFGELLSPGRVATIKDWLVELKTMLPDHAAYAVSAGLTDWQQWVAAARAADWRGAQLEMRVQGQLWRGLITGEKAAADMLNLSGYLAAARQIAKRAIIAARWPILIALLATAGVIVAVLTLHSVSPTARLVAGLAWIGGTLAAAFKASGSLLGSAVKGAEGWLWQTELDESVATVATRMPSPAQHRRVTGPQVGAMTFSAGATFADGDSPPAT
ncbi:MAG TPA: hypothetical protein VH089_11215 [Streptosporangiaceae bacterium]|jgi:hypothetical protein|nr:hypothetical protein [Streptosporangiaceae bacterium]